MAKSSTRPVSLSVHRNTVERRRKKALAAALVVDTERLVREQDIRAYAIVGLAADGSAHAVWDTGSVVPMWAFTDVVSAVLRRSIENNIDVIAEDWRPEITRASSSATVAEATNQVLHDPANSKAAKQARGESLGSKPKASS